MYITYLSSLAKFSHALLLLVCLFHRVDSVNLINFETVSEFADLITPAPSQGLTDTTNSPTALPTRKPTIEPSVLNISRNSITSIPSIQPTLSSTSLPSTLPSYKSTTSSPSRGPTSYPSSIPSESREPTGTPTRTSSSKPSWYPTAAPSSSPTPSPTSEPSPSPTKMQSQSPTTNPTVSPTGDPTSSEQLIELNFMMELPSTGFMDNNGVSAFENEAYLLLSSDVCPFSQDMDVSSISVTDQQKTAAKSNLIVYFIVSGMIDVGSSAVTVSLLEKDVKNCFQTEYTNLTIQIDKITGLFGNSSSAESIPEENLSKLPWVTILIISGCSLFAIVAFMSMFFVTRKKLQTKRAFDSSKDGFSGDEFADNIILASESSGIESSDIESLGNNEGNEKSGKQISVHDRGIYKDDSGKVGILGPEFYSANPSLLSVDSSLPSVSLSGCDDKIVDAMENQRRGSFKFGLDLMASSGDTNVHNRRPAEMNALSPLARSYSSGLRSADESICSPVSPNGAKALSTPPNSKVIGENTRSSVNHTQNESRADESPLKSIIYEVQSMMNEVQSMMGDTTTSHHATQHFLRQPNGEIEVPSLFISGSTSDSSSAQQQVDARCSSSEEDITTATSDRETYGINIASYAIDQADKIVPGKLPDSPNYHGGRKQNGNNQAKDAKISNDTQKKLVHADKGWIAMLNDTAAVGTTDKSAIDSTFDFDELNSLGSASSRSRFSRRFEREFLH